jgi:hypothetical protein
MAPCVHEAGHAVIGHLLGARVAYVRIAGGGAGSGDSLIGTDEPRISAHVRVAGYPAELRYCEMVGDCPADRHPMHSAHDDNERAWASAQEACPGDMAAAVALLAEARETVRGMVTQEWGRIERVARALFDSPDGVIHSGPLSELLAAPDPPSG